MEREWALDDSFFPIALNAILQKVLENTVPLLPSRLRHHLKFILMHEEYEKNINIKKYTYIYIYIFICIAHDPKTACFRLPPSTLPQIAIHSAISNGDTLDFQTWDLPAYTSAIRLVPKLSGVKDWISIKEVLGCGALLL